MSWDKDASAYDDWAIRVKTSEDETLREHVFLGMSLQTGEPILLTHKLLEEHTWMTGSTSAGKQENSDVENDQM